MGQLCKPQIPVAVLGLALVSQPAAAQNPFVGNTVYTAYSDTEIRCGGDGCATTFSHPLGAHTLYISRDGHAFDYSGALQKGAGKGKMAKLGEPFEEPGAAGYQFVWLQSGATIVVRATNAITNYKREAVYTAAGDRCQISIRSSQPGYTFKNSINIAFCKLFQGNPDQNIKP